MKNRISRRRFISGVVSATAAAGLSSCAHLPSPTGGVSGGHRPNVIYMFSDEHRWHSMSFTEMPELRTPNMAALAKQGVSFTNCISNYPVCSPYRAMLMSGRWPYQNGVIDNGIPLKPDGNNLGDVFRNAGYDTAYIGKWHLGGERAEPFGFKESLIWTDVNNHWHGVYHPAQGAPVKTEGYTATLMADQALDFISHQRQEPFFLMLSVIPPHSDFRAAPEDKKALYPKGSLSYRKNYDSKTGSGAKSDIWNQNSWLPYQGYHAHISAVDDQLGRIMHRLDELGIADNTILIYASDHGSMMGSHGLGGKRQPYEESVRVPFVIRWPGEIRSGKKCSAQMGVIDVMPTLCTLAGLTAPSGCVGEDFSPHAYGRPGPEPDAQLIMHISKENASGGENHPAPLFRGIRTPRYTYAVQANGPWLLFDNEKDPFQMQNLVGESSLGDIRLALHKKLAAMLKAANDPFRLPSV